MVSICFLLFGACMIFKAGWRLHEKHYWLARVTSSSSEEDRQAARTLPVDIVAYSILFHAGIGVMLIGISLATESIVTGGMMIFVALLYFVASIFWCLRKMPSRSTN